MSHLCIVAGAITVTVWWLWNVIKECTRSGA
jgi:hypothetical protein